MSKYNCNLCKELIDTDYDDAYIHDDTLDIICYACHDNLPKEEQIKYEVL